MLAPCSTCPLDPPRPTGRPWSRWTAGRGAARHRTTKYPRRPGIGAAHPHRHPRCRGHRHERVHHRRVDRSGHPAPCHPTGGELARPPSDARRPPVPDDSGPDRRLLLDVEYSDGRTADNIDGRPLPATIDNNDELRCFSPNRAAAARAHTTRPTGCLPCPQMAAVPGVNRQSGRSARSCTSSSLVPASPSQRDLSSMPGAVPMPTRSSEGRHQVAWKWWVGPCPDPTCSWSAAAMAPVR